MFNKPFPAVPGGDVRIETPDGVTRTFGDGVRNNLTDARWVSNGCAYGAFPPKDGEGDFFPMTDPQPTMRKPVRGDKDY